MIGHFTTTAPFRASPTRPRTRRIRSIRRARWLFAAAALALAPAAGARNGPLRAATERPLASWQVAGGGPISASNVLCTQIRIAPDGTPHLAYQDFSLPAHRLAVRRLDGNVWAPLTLAGSGSVGEAWYNRMAFGPAGGLYVACRDYGFGGALGVRRCRVPGAAWETIGGGPASAGEAHYTDVAVLPDGRIAVAYQDRTSSPPDRTAVLLSNGGAWMPLSGAGLGGGWCQYQSICAAPDGALCVSFTDGAWQGRATVMRRAPGGTGWRVLGTPGFTPDIPNNLALRLAPDGTPYVAYYVWDQRIVVRRYDGTGWPMVGPSVNGIDLPTVATEGWRQWLGFAIDGAGRPVVAYEAVNLGRRAVVKRWDPVAAAWEQLGPAGFTPGAADYLALDVAPDGTPWIAFRDGTSGRALVMAWR